MSADNVTTTAPDAGQPDSFDAIYYRMQTELDGLRCALSAFEADDWEASEEASAGINLLRRTIRALESQYGELERWHMAMQGARSS